MTGQKSENRSRCQFSYYQPSQTSGQSRILGTYQEADRSSIMVNVSRLRKKMTLDYELENMIETVWSKGYRFIVK